MDKNQFKGRTDEAKGKARETAGKITGNKRTEYKGKAEKHAGKATTVLADLNNDARKASR